MQSVSSIAKDFCVKAKIPQNIEITTKHNVVSLSEILRENRTINETTKATKGQKRNNKGKIK